MQAHSNAPEVYRRDRTDSFALAGSLLRSNKLNWLLQEVVLPGTTYAGMQTSYLSRLAGALRYQTCKSKT